MRLTRIITGIIALAMMAFLPLAVTSTANAEPTKFGAESSSSGDGTADRALAAKRSVTFVFHGKGSRFNFAGKVGPKGGNVRVILKRANSPRGSYKNYRKSKTRGTGRYSFRNLSRAGYYKAVVPPSRGYQSSSSRVIRVYRT